jgi:hypothetical protein
MVRPEVIRSVRGSARRQDRRFDPRPIHTRSGSAGQPGHIAPIVSLGTRAEDAKTFPKMSVDGNVRAFPASTLPCYRRMAGTGPRIEIGKDVQSSRGFPFRLEGLRSAIAAAPPRTPSSQHSQQASIFKGLFQHHRPVAACRAIEKWTFAVVAELPGTVPKEGWVWDPCGVSLGRWIRGHLALKASSSISSTHLSSKLLAERNTGGGHDHNDH